jgi:hypothetical protein
MHDPASRRSFPDIEERITLPGSRRGDLLPPLSHVAPPAASPSVALAVGFAMGRTRLRRRPMAISSFLGGALVVVAAMIERDAGSAGAVDRALAATFNVIVPLTSFAVAAELCARGNLRDSVWAAARYGLARRDVALGAMGAGLVAAAGLGAVFALLAVFLAHAEANPPLSHDAPVSAWIGALTAAAYTAWFCVGSTFGRRGGGRWAPLIADFALGTAPGALGAILPRAHAVNLLGGAPPLGLAQASSTAVLVASVLLLTGAAALRCRE